MKKLFFTNLASILFCSTLFAASAPAGTSLISVNSGGVPTAQGPNATSLQVFGGSTFNSCVGDGKNACNSCANGQWGPSPIMGFSANPQMFPKGLACNEHQVDPSLSFSVTVASSNAGLYPTSDCTGGYPVVANVNGTMLMPNATETGWKGGVANQPITATWTWSTLCSALSGDPTCQTSFNATFMVGFATNSNGTCSWSGLGEPGVAVQMQYRYVANSVAQSFGCGHATPFESFCHFTILPEDREIEMNSVEIPAMNPSLLSGDLSVVTKGPLSGPLQGDVSNMREGAFRLYYAKGSDPSVITTASAHADFAVDEQAGTIKNPRIHNLANGTRLVFLSASVDQAGNVTLFSDPYGRANDDGSYSASLTPVGQTQSAMPNAGSVAK